MKIKKNADRHYLQMLICIVYGNRDPHIAQIRIVYNIYISAMFVRPETYVELVICIVMAEKVRDPYW